MPPTDAHDQQPLATGLDATAGRPAADAHAAVVTKASTSAKIERQAVAAAIENAAPSALLNTPEKQQGHSGAVGTTHWHGATKAQSTPRCRSLCTVS